MVTEVSAVLTKQSGPMSVIRDGIVMEVRLVHIEHICHGKQVNVVELGSEIDTNPEQFLNHMPLAFIPRLI